MRIYKAIVQEVKRTSGSNASQLICQWDMSERTFTVEKLDAERPTREILIAAEGMADDRPINPTYLGPLSALVA